MYHCHADDEESNGHCRGLVGMLITAIAVIIVGPLVKLESPGPLFFSQKRVGEEWKNLQDL